MSKPIAFVTGYHDGYPVIQPVDGAAVLSTGMALYAHPAPDFAELVEALQQIVNGVPAGDGCGGFFIEHCDQDGNYIGTESVNPFDVALTLHSIAQAALAKWEGK